MGVLSAGGLGRVVAQWIVDGRPDVDVTGFDVARFRDWQLHPRHRADRTAEILGTVYAAHTPGVELTTGRGEFRSPVHDRLVAEGAKLRDVSGWESADWYAGRGRTPTTEPGWGHHPWFAQWETEHRTVREAVGIMDMSFMAKFAVRGPDAGAVLDRLSAGAVNQRDGVITYTQWLDECGGIRADLTVTRLAADDFLVVASDTAHGSALGQLRRAVGDARATRRGRHDRPRPAHRAGPGLPRHARRGGSRHRLVDGGDPLPGRAPRRDRRHRRARHPDHLPRRARLGALRPGRPGGGGLGRRPRGGRGARHPPGRPAGPVEPADGEGLPRLRARHRQHRRRLRRRASGSPSRSTSPAGSPGATPPAAAKERGTPHHRLVQVLLDDPEPLLFHAEPVLRDGVVVGEVRSASYGWTLGGAVGLAFVGHDGPVTPQWLADGTWEVDVAGTRHPARVSLRPLYDPTSARVTG